MDMTVLRTGRSINFLNIAESFFKEILKAYRNN
jgi:hypothetical protein